MKVYHGSLEIVSRPEMRKPNRTLDYGSGFYTTTFLQQAEDWVRRKTKESETAHGYVNVYELRTGNGYNENAHVPTAYRGMGGLRDAQPPSARVRP